MTDVGSVFMLNLISWVRCTIEMLDSHTLECCGQDDPDPCSPCASRIVHARFLELYLRRVEGDLS